MTYTYWFDLQELSAAPICGYLSVAILLGTAAAMRRKRAVVPIREPVFFERRREQYNTMLQEQPSSSRATQYDVTRTAATL